MCMFGSAAPAAPTLPPDYAASAAPDGAAVKDAAARRVTDATKAAPSTILTSGSGVTATAPTEKKTLLGQ